MGKGYIKPRKPSAKAPQISKKTKKIVGAAIKFVKKKGLPPSCVMELATLVPNIKPKIVGEILRKCYWVPVNFPPETGNLTEEHKKEFRSKNVPVLKALPEENP